MKTYLVSISWYGPYPKSFEKRVQASSLATATARALRDWKKNGGQRVEDIKINVKKL